MAPQPIEGSSYIVTASTISSTTQKSHMTLFTGIFQRFRSSGLQQQPKPTIVHPDPLSEVESVSLPSSPVPSSSGGSSLSSPSSSVSQLPEDSSFTSPSTLRSRSHRQQSTATAISATSRRTHRKSRTTRRGQLSEENVQDLQDSIAVARYLIPGYPSTSTSTSSRFPEPWSSHHSDDSCPPEHPENPLLTAILVVIISSITFICSLAKSFCISSSQYLSQVSSNMAHSWRSWRAGYRLQRQPTSSPSSPSRKRNVPLRTRITRWFKGSPANHPPPPPIWPPPSLVQASTNRNRTTNPIPPSHSNAAAGPSAAAPIPRGRGVRRPAPMEYAPPPPPPKSMAKPPMKQWQRRRPVTRTQATSNYPSSSSVGSAQGPSSSSSASRLAKIDLQVQVARGMMKSAFQKFREMFHYEVADAEDIFDNPLGCSLMRQGEGKNLELMLDVNETQPTIVTHRMYWQGCDEEVPKALSLAVESLLTHLTITNCSISLVDVRSVLLLCPSLQTLDVRQITGTAEPVARLVSQAESADLAPHGLQSLTLTAAMPVDALLDEIQFRCLQSLSLRLLGDGKWTTFKFLSRLGPPFNRLRVRGDIPPAVQSFIKRAVATKPSGFEFDFAPAYESGRAC